MARNRSRVCAAGFVLLAILPPLSSANLVPNPEFDGGAGLNLPIGTGVVNAPAGVPDFWRAFAVNGDIDLEVVPLAADAIFPGSPATNAVLLRVNAFGADQGFDDDNGRFEIIANSQYQSEVYVMSANADGSDQSFNVGFPLFAGPPEAPGGFLGVEPGGIGSLVANSAWQKFNGPVFVAPQEAGNGHISFRVNDDGGENAILIALPAVPSPEPTFSAIPAMSWPGYAVLVLSLLGLGILVHPRVRARRAVFEGGRAQD